MGEKAIDISFGRDIGHVYLAGNLPMNAPLASIL
jgi:hypothetical protein